MFSTLKEAFTLTQNAFNLADEFQVPVIILTDQYIVNSMYNLPSLDHEKLNVTKYIVETDENYKRYELTESGISPRGVPGYGKGFVRVDSHTHTPEGYITESAEIETLASSVPDNGDVYFVPAFSGLYAPYWQYDARGIIAGLTSFANKGHIARAALEATAY